MKDITNKNFHLYTILVLLLLLFINSGCLNNNFTKNDSTRITQDGGSEEDNPENIKEKNDEKYSLQSLIESFLDWQYLFQPEDKKPIAYPKDENLIKPFDTEPFFKNCGYFRDLKPEEFLSLNIENFEQILKIDPYLDARIFLEISNLSTGLLNDSDFRRVKAICEAHINDAPPAARPILLGEYIATNSNEATYRYPLEKGSTISYSDDGVYRINLADGNSFYLLPDNSYYEQNEYGMELYYVNPEKRFYRIWLGTALFSRNETYVNLQLGNCSISYYLTNPQKIRYIDSDKNEYILKFNFPTTAEESQTSTYDTLLIEDQLEKNTNNDGTDAGNEDTEEEDADGEVEITDENDIPDENTYKIPALTFNMVDLKIFSTDNLNNITYHTNKGFSLIYRQKEAAGIKEENQVYQSDKSENLLQTENLESVIIEKDDYFVKISSNLVKNYFRQVETVRKGIFINQILSIYYPEGIYVSNLDTENPQISVKLNYPYKSTKIQDFIFYYDEKDTAFIEKIDKTRLERILNHVSEFLPDNDTLHVIVPSSIQDYQKLLSGSQKHYFANLPDAFMRDGLIVIWPLSCPRYTNESLAGSQQNDGSQDINQQTDEYFESDEFYFILLYQTAVYRLAKGVNFQSSLPEFIKVGLPLFLVAEFDQQVKRKLNERFDILKKSGFYFKLSDICLIDPMQLNLPYSNLFSLFSYKFFEFLLNKEGYEKNIEYIKSFNILTLQKNPLIIDKFSPSNLFVQDVQNLLFRVISENFTGIFGKNLNDFFEEFLKYIK